MDGKELKKLLVRAVKLAVGSSAAIYAAEALHLQFATSAGCIAFLTIVTTKWETVRLSLFRVITFILSVGLAWVLFVHVGSEWAAFGIFVFVITVLCELRGWKAAVSVNIVIGTHFLNTGNYTAEFIANEGLLVLIGISTALLLNLFHGNDGRRKDIIRHMRETEAQLQNILGELAAYLSNMQWGKNVWEDLRHLEEQLGVFVHEAHEYQDNTFHSHPVYYIDYFEMRSSQCRMLHNLHDEMRKIRMMPRQAKIISEYIDYMKEYVVEMNVPSRQIEALEQIFRDMEREPLPVTREEFESRALLYHVLMDLEEFLMYKKRFVETLDENIRERYWKKADGAAGK